MNFIRQNNETIQNGNKDVTVTINNNMTERQQYMEISDKLEDLIKLGIIDELFWRLESDYTSNIIKPSKDYEEIYEVVDEVSRDILSDYSFNEILYTYFIELENKLKELELIKKD